MPESPLSRTALTSGEVATILDSVADGVFTVDGGFRVTSFNRTAEQITGVPRREAIGQPCCEIFRASICEAQCALKETMQTGRSVVNRQACILRADGERVPISASGAGISRCSSSTSSRASIVCGDARSPA